MQGIGPTNSQDALTVQSYIQSRDAMTTLDHSIGLRSIYESPDIDFFHRFPLYGNKTLEQFYDYYNKVIGVDVDPVSSVVTLTVTGFDQSKVTKINEALLRASEKLVNRLNDKMEADIVASARTDMENAEKQFLKAGGDLNAFQLSKGIIDPEKEAALEKERIGRMQDALTEAQVHLAEIRSVSPNSLQIKPLQQRIAALEQSVANTQKSAITGSNSLMAHSADFQARKVNQDLAVHELTNASQRLETALIEATRRQIYLDRIAEPSQPDDSIEPQRIINILVTIVFAFMAWAIISLLTAGFREHHE
jgi:capsular polysaccharide transport system permease protein